MCLCPRPPRLRSAIALLVGACLVITSVHVEARAAAEAPGAHAPPVDAPVVDPYRPPPGAYGPGNRGLDYATSPGTDVVVSAPGQVTFAGPVGGANHVVVLHPDGLRTSYSFLATVSVRRGQVLATGAVVGRSGGTLHFGARAGDRYLDPALLFGGGETDVRLVPVEQRVPGSIGEERRSLVAQLVSSGALGGTLAARWLADAGAGAVRATMAVGSDVLGAAVEAGRTGLPVVARTGARVAFATVGAGVVLRDVAVARARGGALLPLLTAGAITGARRSFDELREDQAVCTPGDEPVPPQPSERRIVVMVAGYGSRGGAADVLDVDTVALGYADADRVQLSYAGGRAPEVGSLAGVPTSPYGPADSMVDLRTSGAHLRRLLRDIASAHPGVPIDVIAHSQGGLVVREALTTLALGERLPVGHVVTLASPHHGAPAASLAGTLGISAASSTLGDGLAAATGGGVDPGAASVAQMAEGSAFLSDLGQRALPPSVAFTSVAGAGDLVVPALSSTAEGATNALVDLGGPTAHSHLPGSPVAGREIALALGGAPPTCVPVATLAIRVATAAVVTAAEHAVGATAPAVVLVDGVAGLLLGLPGAA